MLWQRHRPAADSANKVLGTLMCELWLLSLYTAIIGSVPIMAGLTCREVSLCFFFPKTEVDEADLKQDR